MAFSKESSPQYFDNLAAPTQTCAATSCQARAEYSRFCQRLRRRYASEISQLPAGALSQSEFKICLQHLLQQHSLSSALRILRQLVLERLMQRDIEENAPLEEITTCMTQLAELSLDHAYEKSYEELVKIHGEPTDSEGHVSQFWIVGMGKLGARELNVSSDIDLIYVFEYDGYTANKNDIDSQPQPIKSISNQEFFSKLVRQIQTLIGDVSEHGFVFRVDLALRPHGKSGPPVISLEALNDYFLIHGREWERFAWLKSRIVAPTKFIQTENISKLYEVVSPFVFRRYLDYAVFDALRDLRRQIRIHASERCVGKPERANDVKISRGGIREIEFIVQLLQVVRGGQYPELICRPTLKALRRLAQAEFITGQIAEQLTQAYAFLRRIEHRIQYLDDQQTHTIPSRDDDLLWLANSMGFPCSAQFLSELDVHREIVAQEFDALLGGDSPKKCQNGLCHKITNPATFNQLLKCIPPEFAAHIAYWAELPRFRQLKEKSLARVLKILHTTGQWQASAEIDPQAACRFSDWLESLLGRDSYFALLVERPIVHKRIIHMVAAAVWPLRFMLRHPSVIDELADGALLHERFSSAMYLKEVDFRQNSLMRTFEANDEDLMDLLRRAHHAELFRTLARDVEKCISVEAVADDLSALADATLQITTNWCWKRLRQRHRDTPEIAIIGYGKLGGKELGYGSDLDIVFLFDDEHEDAPEIYAYLARKLIVWLSAKTGEGNLYEIDTALRPNGNSGLLVTSFAAFSSYQKQRGTNTAWTWEHQAMTRARFVLGSPSLKERFDTVRQAVIQAPRDRSLLRDEIYKMRKTMRTAHTERLGFFNIKHSPGGMIDIEFATQYLVLAYSRECPKMVSNAGNIALLKIAEEQGLLPDKIGKQAAESYRKLRYLQHIDRLLNEGNGFVNFGEVQSLYRAGLALWQFIFESSDTDNEKIPSRTLRQNDFHKAPQ